MPIWKLCLVFVDNGKFYNLFLKEIVFQIEITKGLLILFLISRLNNEENLFGVSRFF